jgi:hypothetical protein
MEADMVDNDISNKNDVSNNAQWCFAWYADRPATSAEERAALVEKNKWPKGSTILIGFVDGTPEQQAHIEA